MRLSSVHVVVLKEIALAAAVSPRAAATVRNRTFQLT